MNFYTPYIILLIIILTFQQGFSQNTIHIDTIIVLPSLPTDIDSLKIRVKVINTDYGQKIYDSLSFSGDTINIQYCLHQSVIPTAAIYIDTFNIGTLPEGNYFIKVKAYRSGDMSCSSKIDSASENKTFSVAPATFIQDMINEQDYSILLFPNPSEHHHKLIVKSENERYFIIQLFDLSGRKIRSIYNGQILQGEKNFSLDLGDLESGYYFYKITTKENKHNINFIVTKGKH